MLSAVESEIAHLDNERKEHWKKQKELKKQQAMVSVCEIYACDAFRHTDLVFLCLQ